MSSGFVLKLLIVASAFIVYCEAGTHLVSLNATNKQLIEEAKASKHPRCFTLYRVHCNQTNYPGYDFDITRWYYSATRKVCFPLYLPRGENKLCPGIIDWVIDLPYTKKECEDLCGEPCTIVHTNHKTEPGICMMNCRILVPKGTPYPCLPSHYGCCPRNYEPPIVPPIKSKFNVDTAFFDTAVPFANFTMKSNFNFDTAFFDTAVPFANFTMKEDFDF